MNFLFRPLRLLAAVILFMLLFAACRQTAPDSLPATLPLPPAPTHAAATNASPDRLSAYPPPPTVPPHSDLPYPVATATAVAYPPPAASPTLGTPLSQVYLPSVQMPRPSTTPTPAATQTPSPTPTPTIDFRIVRAQLQANNQDLGFVKMGFHIGPGGNRTGLGIWMHRLEAAGVPFFLKSADDTGGLVEAQEILRNSEIPHTLVYRTSGQQYDTPDYTLAPEEAARGHWALHKSAWPPELDPNLVWIETVNEVDKNRSEWLAHFALETARLAMADGFRWAAFGWSSGEPEPAAWQAPAMLEFLRLAGNNPDRLAIALHEYSYLSHDIGHEYPYKLGRFQQLFQIADQHNIPRPTVLITEWGWEYDNVPEPAEALQDIAWASRMYASYPQVKGAAIWYLGPGYAGIADEAQRLLTPVTEYALGNYFAIPQPPAQAQIAPEQYAPAP